MNARLDHSISREPDIEWFSDYSVKVSGTVRLSNEQECVIEGIREVLIQLVNDNSIILHRVWYIPELRSLVSIRMLAEVGYHTTLSELSWMII